MQIDEWFTMKPKQQISPMACVGARSDCCKCRRAEFPRCVHSRDEHLFSSSEILFSAWVRLLMLLETNLPLWFSSGCIQAAGGAAAGEEPLPAVRERHAAHHQQRPEW